MQIQTVHGSRIKTRTGSSIHAGGAAVRFGKEMTFGTADKSQGMSDRLYEQMYGSESDAGPFSNVWSDNEIAQANGVASDMRASLTDDGRQLYSMLKRRDRRKYERYYKRSLSRQQWMTDEAENTGMDNLRSHEASGTGDGGTNTLAGHEYAQMNGAYRNDRSPGKKIYGAVNSSVSGAARTAVTVTNRAANTAVKATAGASTLGAGTVAFKTAETITDTVKAGAKAAKKVTDKMQQQSTSDMQGAKEIALTQSRTAVKEDAQKKQTEASSFIVIILAFAFIVMFTFTSLVNIGATVMQYQNSQNNPPETNCTKLADAATEELKDAEFTVGGYRYKNWYGMDDNWCAMFVSYCANKCGFIESGVMPKTASVAAMKQWYINRNLFQPAGSGYEPKAGDVIIFGNGMSHTGIVTGYDSATKTVTTIEGNSGRSSVTPYHKGSHVKEHHYPITYAKIAGYGTPQYPDDTVENEAGQGE